MHKLYHVIVLDFDGVIVESVEIKDRAFEILFQGFPAHLGAIMQYHRSHNATIRYEKFKFIYEDILGQPYTEAVANRLSNDFSRIVFDQIVRCPLVRGAEDFLDSFCRTVFLYLVSINPKEELQAILRTRQLNGFFTDVYAHPWRKVDALRDILCKNDITVSQAVFVGDSPEDYQAAQMAGIDFIARYSNKSWEGFPVSVYSDLVGVKEHLCRST